MRSLRLRFAATTVVCGLALVSCSGGGGSPPVSQIPQTAGAGHRSAMQTSCLLIMESAFRPSPAREQLQATQSCSGVGKISRATSAEARTPLGLAGSAGITTFDVPGAATASECQPFELFFNCGTNVESINNAGEIAGFYLDSQLNAIAYIRGINGTYTSFSAPGAGNPHLGTAPYTITNSHITGGFFLDPQDFQHSFIRFSNGSFVTYDPPFITPETDDLSSLNAKGEAGGHYFNGLGGVFAYLRSPDGTFVSVTPPNAISEGICYVDCLNNAGAAAGNFTDLTGEFQGYIRSQRGSFTLINIPGSAFTEIEGINASGTTAGFWNDAHNLSTAWIRSARGTFTFFQAPDASTAAPNGTNALAINNSGAVAGLYADAKGVVHGFYRSSTGKFSEFDPPGSVQTVPTGMNDSGQVAGFWYDSQGQVHGFRWRAH